MAVDMFLKLTNIKGESMDDGHKDEIDVLAWSWGMSQSGTTHTAKGGGAGKVSVQDVSVTKWVDNASATLAQYCCKGTHIDEGNLVVRKAGDTPLEYIKLDMKDMIITSVSTGGSGGEDRLTENVSLNFSEFKMTYTPQEDTGAGGTAVEFGWDIAKNITA
ncbi:MAG TPA: type VI secretion system tube protein Hcp [Paracoccaceae bacterium]|nr:type VI secretion system tube protein Hcp [Paracoccaceae bacterium]